MTAAERAIADVLTFRRFWGDAWALRRIEIAALEMAQAAHNSARLAEERTTRIKVDPRRLEPAIDDEPDLPPIGRATFQRPPK